MEAIIPSKIARIEIPNTDWAVTEIVPISQSGMVKTGSVTISKVGVPRRRLNWRALNASEGRWIIDGDGAELPSGGRVPDVKKFPFSLEPTFNNGLKHIIADWLNEQIGYSKKNGTPVEGTTVPTNTESEVSTKDDTRAKTFAPVSAVEIRPPTLAPTPSSEILSLQSNVSLAQVSGTHETDGGQSSADGNGSLNGQRVASIGGSKVSPFMRTPERDASRERNSRLSPSEVYLSLTKGHKLTCDWIALHSSSTSIETAKALGISNGAMNARMNAIYFQFGVSKRVELLEKLRIATQGLASTPPETPQPEVEKPSTHEEQAETPAVAVEDIPQSGPKYVPPVQPLVPAQIPKSEDDELPYAVTQLKMLSTAVECLRRMLASEFEIDYSPHVNTNGIVDTATVNIRRIRT